MACGTHIQDKQLSKTVSNILMLSKPGNVISLICHNSVTTQQCHNSKCVIFLGETFKRFEVL